MKISINFPGKSEKLKRMHDPPGNKSKLSILVNTDEQTLTLLQRHCNNNSWSVRMWAQASCDFCTHPPDLVNTILVLLLVSNTFTLLCYYIQYMTRLVPFISATTQEGLLKLALLHQPNAEFSQPGIMLWHKGNALCTIMEAVPRDSNKLQPPK